MRRFPRSPLVFAWMLVFVCLASSAWAQFVSVEPATSRPDEEEFTLDILLDPEGETVMGMEISLSFDSAVVQLNGIDPGPWFTNLAPDWFFWDYTHPGTELIYFTGASLGSGLSAGGVVATCRFTALQAGICPLNFLGVDLRDPQNASLSTTHSSGDVIIIDDAVAVDSVSWGRVKKLYH